MSEISKISEIMRLMQEAAYEIRDLRRRNEILAAKVDTMDLLAAMLFAQVPQRTLGASPDIAWALERQIAELKTPEAQHHKTP